MAKNENIFLGSGASLMLVPEVDLWIPIDDSSDTEPAGGNTLLTTTSAYYGNFELVPNLYVGCTVDIYRNSVPKFTVTDTTLKVLYDSNNYAQLDSDSLDIVLAGETSASFGTITSIAQPVVDTLE